MVLVGVCVWYGVLVHGVLSLVHLSRIINLGFTQILIRVVTHSSLSYSMLYGGWQLGLFTRRPPSHSHVAHVDPKGRVRVGEVEPRLVSRLMALHPIVGINGSPSMLTTPYELLGIIGSHG